MTGKNAIVVHGLKLSVARIGVGFSIIGCALRKSPNPVNAIRFLLSIIRERKNIHDNSGGFKAVRSGGKYYWSINHPGWPSDNFNHFISNEFDRLHFPDKSHLQTIILGISAICPLDCIHCYESDNLSGQEKLSFEDLKIIMDKISHEGIRHIQFSGGEPLSRFNEMLALMEEYGNSFDYWINTSGFGLTEEKASAMKEKGMTGAVISLDHWDEEKHNSFRRNNHSFRWVKEAVQNCNNAGILVCLSLCPVREFVTAENLGRYHSLAKELGAGFIRIMEPRNTGRFAGQDVILDKDQIRLIDSFTLSRNRSREHRDYPVIQFPGHYQRKAGCLGSGNRYIYIDPAGHFHSCPFCRKPLGNVLELSLPEGIRRAQESGCHVFRQQVLIS